MEPPAPEVAAVPREARCLDALTQVAAALARGHELDEVLSTALDAVLGAVGSGFGVIYLLDEARGELRVSPHQRGVGSARATALKDLGRADGLILRSLAGAAVVIVPDPDGHAGSDELERRLGLRSMLLAPLHSRRRALGVLAVGGDARAFDAQDRRLLEAVGGMLGGAVESAHLLARTQRHLDQVRALWEIDRAIVEDRELSVVLDVIAREAGRLGGGDCVIVLLEDGPALEVAGVHGPDALRVLGHPPMLAGTPLAALLGSPQPQTLAIADPERGPLEARVIPLRAGERALGGLVVVTPEAKARPEDLEILSTFAHQAAVALVQARVRDAEGRRAAQLALVSAASEIAASTLDVDVLLGSVARYVQRSFNYYAVTIYVVEPKARRAFLAGAAGAGTLIPKRHAVRFGQGIVGWVAERGEYVMAGDVRREPRFVRSGMEATLAELAVPVRLSGEVVAVLNVESDRLNAFDEGDLVALDAIAAQVAAAIRNARLFEEKVRALRNLEIVQEITNVLNSDLEMGALLDRIARRSVEAVRPAQMGAVLLYDGETLGVRSSYGYPNPAALAEVRLAFHEGLPGGVFVSGHGRVAASGPDDHGRHRAAFQRAAGGHSPQGALCVPICLPHEKLGVLLLESFTADENFDADDLLFALTLADQAAIAIGNAVRLRQILELDRQRQDYLSNVSHELRTPLTVIQGYLEALCDGTAGDQSEQFLRVARDQAQRLGRLIDEVLQVARLERGIAQEHLAWGSVTLPAVLRKALQGLRQDIVLKELVVREHVPLDLPAVTGDERLLHLMLHHVLENAIKFTEPGGSIEVSVAPQAAEVVVSVSDSGIGIPNEHQSRVFEKFYTVDQGLARSHAGAGMGLYLAREVVAIHRGAIRLESRPGQGTRIEVRLPAASDA